MILLLEFFFLYTKKISEMFLCSYAMKVLHLYYRHSLKFYWVSKLTVYSLFKKNNKMIFNCITIYIHTSTWYIITVRIIRIFILTTFNKLSIITFTLSLSVFLFQCIFNDISSFKVYPTPLPWKNIAVARRIDFPDSFLSFHVDFLHLKDVLVLVVLILETHERFDHSKWYIAVGVDISGLLVFVSLCSARLFAL